ncbi:MAG: hypothetical protein ACXQT1_03995 [Methermicoccaceae archaeon]
MPRVRDAKKSATTIVVRSDSKSRISSTREPYTALMLRLFRSERTAGKARQFLNLVEERQHAGNPLKSGEWEWVLEELGLSRSSFYSMRNKLLGAGMLSINSGEYHISGVFSKDMHDMARWWWTAVCGYDDEAL